MAGFLKAGFLKAGCLSVMRAAVRAIALALPLVFMVSQPAEATCTFFSVPQRYNTQTVDGVIVIGEQRNRPYRVVVLGDDEETLRRIQACVLDAFATRSKFGPFIQVGSFDRRQDAEALRRILRREGYNTRVTYQR